MRLSSRLLAVSEIRPGSWARAWNSWGRSVRLDFQALFLEVIPKALAAPMVVALWAHLLEVAGIAIGHVMTSVTISCPASLAKTFLGVFQLPCTEPHLSRLFSQILSSFFLNFVGVERPTLGGGAWLKLSP